MKISYKAFILPHIGDPFRLCADRFAIGEKEMAYAISDGVGNSLFPEVWAQSLCEDYVQTPGDFICENKLSREDDLISHWETVRDERVASFTPDQMFIYEMGLDKADFAAATFVGLRFLGKNWHCLALGDSYLVILDKEFNVIQQVASMEGRPFDNYPEYFASKGGYNNGTPVFRTGSLSEGQYFILMSDAISDWFLAEERTTDQRRALVSIDSHEQYKDFVGELRKSGELKDDDTTIVVITVHEIKRSKTTFERLEVDNIDFLIQNDAPVPEETEQAPSCPDEKVEEESQTVENTLDSTESVAPESEVAENTDSSATETAPESTSSDIKKEDGESLGVVEQEVDTIVPQKEEETSYIESLQTQLAQKKEEYETLQSILKQRNDRISELENQVKDLERQIELLKRNNNELSSENNELRNSLTESQRQLEEKSRGFLDRIIGR